MTSQLLQGCFRRGVILEVNEKTNTYCSRYGSRKNWNFSRYSSVFAQKEWGNFPLFFPGGTGDFGRGQSLCNEVRPGPEWNWLHPGLKSEKVKSFWENRDFSILSWLRIELMTSQLSKVLSKGVILEVKEKTNTWCSRADVGKVEIFLRK